MWAEAPNSPPRRKATLSSSIPTTVWFWSITHPQRDATFPWTFIQQSKLMLTHLNREYTLQNLSSWSLQDASDFKCFPFNNFTYCLTLFSKFFSSFPRGTCSLSVSRQYLALDGIYHPFRAAFPNNSTLWGCITKPWWSVPKTGLSPSMMFCSKKLMHRSSADSTSLNYNSDRYKTCQILNLSFSLFTRSY